MERQPCRITCIDPMHRSSLPTQKQNVHLTATKVELVQHKSKTPWQVQFPVYSEFLVGRAPGNACGAIASTAGCVYAARIRIMAKSA